jgi:hypothetical protein
LVVPARGSESFEATNLGFDIIGFDIEVHALLA